MNIGMETSLSPKTLERLPIKVSDRNLQYRHREAQQTLFFSPVDGLITQKK